MHRKFLRKDVTLDFCDLFSIESNGTVLYHLHFCSAFLIPFKTNNILCFRLIGYSIATQKAKEYVKYKGITFLTVSGKFKPRTVNISTFYRSGTVNLKSFVGNVLL